MFVGLHALLAVRLETPEIAISDDEGVQFAKAAQNVMRHYSVKTTQKTLDTIALAGVTVGIYGPRFAAWRFRKAAEKAERAAGRTQGPIMHATPSPPANGAINGHAAPPTQPAYVPDSTFEVGAATDDYYNT
jgi:hypothetical protein